MPQPSSIIRIKMKLSSNGFVWMKIFQGTGLGLMMCYKIIEEHHGRLHISSELNKGTIVDIRWVK
jgi:signal transduction histidine kinase